ncbi:hypothetical protein GUJ93_ZPchr0013g37247 [Zizania palustris]|uniref:Transmembrane protein 230 n=1 Tax=Zizania palustris TaxID=103762 RepID=A0A8J6BXJ3_ZIZPA|nr:hypothetical protein GUJ93_ZPchr0013g37247 [Zizania palustris]
MSPDLPCASCSWVVCNIVLPVSRILSATPNPPPGRLRRRAPPPLCRPPPTPGASAFAGAPFVEFSLVRTPPPSPHRRRRSSRHCIMAARRNVRYSSLPTEDRDDSNLTDDVDLRFAYTPKSLRRIPWKSIALALFLLFLGSSLLFLSYFIFTGHMEGDNSQIYGLLFLGILAFLPGM